MSSKIESIKCPKCGSEMKKGYIAGHWFRLRWTEKAKTKTVLEGEPLRKKIDWWNSPTLNATRCEKCKIGLFTYND